jgi:replicative DNA helicase
MDLERALVCKIVSTGQIETAVARGLREDLFYDEQCRELFSWLLAHTRRYKTPPSMTAVKEDHPKFDWFHVEDPLDYLIDKFVVLAKRRLADKMVVELAQACDDPERAKNIDLEFLEVSRKLATLVPSTQVSKYKEGMEGRIEAQELAQKEGKPPGVPFGFPWLDEKTGGLQRHEFATVAAFSGQGKSTFLMTTAFNAFMSDFTPLYISLEMEEAQLHRKWDAMAASLDYWKIKQLRLEQKDFDQWRKTKEEISKRTGEIPVIDSIRHCTPDHVFAEAVRYKPDLIIIDYLSLMRTARPTMRNGSLWQSVTEITQDLKQVARTLKVPILAAAQTNRGGAKDGADLDNIGYALSIVQDSDIVIGLHADDEMKEQKEMEIRLRKNRDGGLGDFRAIWNHETMVFREKTLRDMYKRGDKVV